MHVAPPPPNPHNPEVCFLLCFTCGHIEDFDDAICIMHMHREREVMFTFALKMRKVMF